MTTTVALFYLFCFRTFCTVCFLYGATNSNNLASNAELLAYNLAMTRMTIYDNDRSNGDDDNGERADEEKF